MVRYAADFERRAPFADPREFWLDVAWHVLIGAAAIAMAVSWLRK